MDIIESKNQKIDEVIRILQNYRNIMNDAIKNNNASDVQERLKLLYSYTVNHIFNCVKRVTDHCDTNQ